MQRITVIFIATILTLITAYDFYAIANGGTEASISWFLITKSYDVPLIPFLAGIVCGHLFWRMRNVKGTDKLGSK